MGDKISFKIIVESCPTGFDFVYDLNCVANLTKKGERCEIDNLKGISIIFFFLFLSLYVYIFYI